MKIYKFENIITESTSFSSLTYDLKLTTYDFMRLKNELIEPTLTAYEVYEVMY